MAGISPAASITLQTIKTAVRQAADGLEGEIKDAQCRGLRLRIRGGRVYWTIRCRFGSEEEQRRWDIGDSDTPPNIARDRANRVKSMVREGIDPSTVVEGWKTSAAPAPAGGAPAPKSIEWTGARQKFLVWTKEKRAQATYDDYRAILTNTPELARFEGRLVATITPNEIARTLVDISQRAQPHAEHVQRVYQACGRGCLILTCKT